MSTQYGRIISLVVADATGNGLDFKNFRCEFRVCRGDIQTPNSLDARIYNLSATTARKIQGTEYTQMSLSVGYQGTATSPGTPVKQIFRGTIRQYRAGRVNQTDSYVDLTAADADEAYNFAPVFASVPSGSTQSQIATLLAQALAAQGHNQNITLGYTPTFQSNGLIRGKVLYGMARDHARKFADNNGCKFSIQDGNINFIPLTGYIPNGAEIPTIGVTTGLIGVPEQTQQGIRIRTLLNPDIKIGQLIQLDTNDINQFRYGLDTQSSPINPALASSVGLNQRGLYYVMHVNHVGDTRGQEWYSDMVCLSCDATVPLNVEAITNPYAIGPVPVEAFGQLPSSK